MNFYLFASLVCSFSPPEKSKKSPTNCTGRSKKFYDENTRLLLVDTMKLEMPQQHFLVESHLLDEGQIGFEWLMFCNFMQNCHHHHRCCQWHCLIGPCQSSLEEQGSLSVHDHKSTINCLDHECPSYCVEHSNRLKVNYQNRNVSSLFDNNSRLGLQFNSNQIKLLRLENWERTTLFVNFSSFIRFAQNLNLRTLSTNL